MAWVALFGLVASGPIGVFGSTSSGAVDSSAQPVVESSPAGRNWVTRKPVAGGISGGSMTVLRHSIVRNGPVPVDLSLDGKKNPYSDHGEYRVLVVNRLRGTVRSLKYQADDSFRQYGERPTFAAATQGGRDLVAVVTSSIRDRNGITPASASRSLELWAVDNKVARKWSIPQQAVPGVPVNLATGDLSSSLDLQIVGITARCLVVVVKVVISVNSMPRSLSCISIANGSVVWMRDITSVDQVTVGGSIIATLGENDFLSSGGSLTFLAEADGAPVFDGGSATSIVGVFSDKVVTEEDQPDSPRYSDVVVRNADGSEVTRVRNARTRAFSIDPYRGVALIQSEGGLVALKISTGEIVWRIPPAQVTIAGPNLDSCRGSAGTFRCGVAGQVATLDAATGQQVGVDIVSASKRLTVWQATAYVQELLGVDYFDGRVWITTLDDDRVVSVRSRLVPVALKYGKRWRVVPVREQFRI